MSDPALGVPTEPSVSKEADPSRTELEATLRDLQTSLQLCQKHISDYREKLARADKLTRAHDSPDSAA